jgi:hypothetical protein
VGPAIVRPSEELRDNFSGATTGNCVWLRVHGASDEDCWVDGSLTLCVSDRFMDVLRGARIEACHITSIQ